MKHLKVYENIDSLLGDLGELGLAKDRAYIELGTFDRGTSIAYKKINFPDLDKKNGEITMGDMISELQNLNFEISLENYGKIEIYTKNIWKRNIFNHISRIFSMYGAYSRKGEKISDMLPAESIKDFLEIAKEKIIGVDFGIVYIEGKKILKV